MAMNRPAHIWIPFAIYLAIAFAAMGWVSLTVLEFERSNHETRARELFEDKVRLALWRMDSAVAPIIGRESARPYYVYQPFYAADEAYTSLYTEIQKDAVQLPSPLLTATVPFVRLHFEISDTGELTSPQVPVGNMRDIAEVRHVSHERIEDYRGRLAKLADSIAVTNLHGVMACDLGHAPSESITSADAADAGPEAASSTAQADAPAQVADATNFRNRGSFVEQQRRGQAEWNARQKQVLYNNVISPQPPSVEEGLVRAFWCDDQLFLARVVSMGKREIIQGAWLDWPALRAALARDIKDLLPAGRIETPLEEDPPASDAAPTSPYLEPGPASPFDRRLASFPVRLDPGPVESVAPLEPSALRLSLGAAWACLILASGAVALLLRGAVAMSERRWAFASSVTHELRTPLTTFQMYTEMLSEGMVDDSKRAAYLKTLREEATRLGHLVENVLTYAKLERGPSGRNLERLTVRQLLERFENRLAARARSCGMELAIEASSDDLERPIAVDPSAIEQILFNLVDNACKYAAPADDPRIHLRAACSGDRLKLSIRDHGAGVDAKDERLLFRPFTKGNRHRSMQIPGVGLGLALSRQLARTMQGDLRHDGNGGHEGAAFTLDLPMKR